MKWYFGILPDEGIHTFPSNPSSSSWMLHIHIKAFFIIMRPLCPGVIGSFLEEKEFIRGVVGSGCGCLHFTIMASLSRIEKEGKKNPIPHKSNVKSNGYGYGYCTLTVLAQVPGPCSVQIPPTGSSRS
jgi:hypothetical protein